MPLYRELTPATVPATTRQAAEMALRHGCAALGFALPPEVRWVKMVTNQAEIDRLVAQTPKGQWEPPGYKSAMQPFCGLNDSSHWLMWVATGMDSKQTAITVLHELAHLHYRKTGQSNAWGSKARADEEADVEAWAQAQVGKIA